MAITQQKETIFKLENALSPSNYLENFQTKVSKIRTSMESKIAFRDGDVCDESDTYTDVADSESIYEESLYSDISAESESINITQEHSTSKIPRFRFTALKSLIKEQDSTNLDKSRFASTSKICNDASSFTLEDRMKCLSLNEMRRTKSTQFRPTRKNMSFTNEEIIKIERDNEILLRKIVAQQRSQKVKIQPSQKKLSSSAINRRKLQRKIEGDNMVGLLLETVFNYFSITITN